VKAIANVPGSGVAAICTLPWNEYVLCMLPLHAAVGQIACWICRGVPVNWVLKLPYQLLRVPASMSVPPTMPVVIGFGTVSEIVLVPVGLWLASHLLCNGSSRTRCTAKSHAGGITRVTGSAGKVY